MQNSSTNSHPETFRNGKPKSTTKKAVGERKRRKMEKLQKADARRRAVAGKKGRPRAKKQTLGLQHRMLDVLENNIEVHGDHDKRVHSSLQVIAGVGAGQSSGDAVSAPIDERTTTTTLEASSVTSTSTSVASSNNTIPSSVAFGSQASCSSTTSSLGHGVGAASLQSEPSSYKRKRSDDDDDDDYHHIPKKQAYTSAQSKSPVSSSLISTMSPPRLSCFRDEPIEVLLKLNPSNLDYSEFHFEDHALERGLERGGFQSEASMLVVMKKGNIIENISPKYGGCMISYFAPNGVRQLWPLRLSKDRVTIKTFIAQSPLHFRPHQRSRERMYHGLEELSRLFGVSMKQIGSFLAHAVGAVNTDLLSEISIVDTVIRILPSAEEVRIVQETEYAETMGDVESWVAEIDTLDLNRATDYMHLLRANLQLQELLKTSPDRKNLQQSVGQLCAQMMGTLQ